MDFLFDLALRSLSVEGDGSNHPGQGSRDEVGVIGGPSSSQSETPVTDDDRTINSGVNCCSEEHRRTMRLKQLTRELIVLW